MEKLLLTTTEAATVLGLSKYTVSALLESGQLAAVRIGSAVRVHIDTLKEFASKGSATRTAHGAPRRFPAGRAAEALTSSR